MLVAAASDVEQMVGSSFEEAVVGAPGGDDGAAASILRMPVEVRPVGSRISCAQASSPRLGRRRRDESDARTTGSGRLPVAALRDRVVGFDRSLLVEVPRTPRRLDRPSEGRSECAQSPARDEDPDNDDGNEDQRQP